MTEHQAHTAEPGLAAVELGDTAGLDANALVNQCSRALTRHRTNDNGTVSAHLLIETTQLWEEVLRNGRGAMADPKTITVDQSWINRVLIVRLDWQRVTTAIAALDILSIDPKSSIQAAATALSELQDGLRSAASDTPPSFDIIVNERPQDTRPYLETWASRTRLLIGVATSSSVLHEVESRADSAMDVVRDTGESLNSLRVRVEREIAQLNEIRAEKAQHELSTQFKNLRKKERTASNGFRLLTFALLTAAAIAGSQIAGNDPDDWAAIASHVVLATALGGAAVYTGRLASTHRVSADWAASITVQLDTFRDFLAAVERNDVRDRVYEEFGRRVLGPPPSLQGTEEPPALALLAIAEIAAARAQQRDTSA